MKQYARTLVAMAFFIGLAGAVKAKAEVADVVTVPFEFFVGAKVLPAGKYTVRNLSDDKSSPLVMSSQRQGTSIFVMPYVTLDPNTPDFILQSIPQFHPLPQL